MPSIMNLTIPDIRDAPDEAGGSTCRLPILRRCFMSRILRKHDRKRYSVSLGTEEQN